MPNKVTRLRDSQVSLKVYCMPLSNAGLGRAVISESVYLSSPRVYIADIGIRVSTVGCCGKCEKRVLAEYLVIAKVGDFCNTTKMTIAVG